MRYGLRPLVIFLVLITFVIAAAGGIGWRIAWTSALGNYQALIQDGRDKGFRIEEAKAQAVDEWMAALSSPNWKSGLLNADAFSATFPALVNAGFTADIDGYLTLLGTNFPSGEQLGFFSLIRWRNAAALRLALVAPPRSKTIQVFRENGIVRALRIPTGKPDSTMHLVVLENGKYAEYIASRQEKQD